MMLVWDDARSFQRHVKDMGRFSRSHERVERIIKSFRDMPTLLDIEPARNPGRLSAFAMVRGRPAVVPIWDITMPAGSQN